MIQTGESFRLSPAEGGSLRMQRYDLRAGDGKLICTVAREQAERGIAEGKLELWRGEHGAYLRAVGLAYPAIERPSSVQPDSRRMMPAQAPRGAVQPHVANNRRPATGQVGGFRQRRVGPA